MGKQLSNDELICNNKLSYDYEYEAWMQRNEITVPGHIHQSLSGIFFEAKTRNKAYIKVYRISLITNTNRGNRL